MPLPTTTRSVCRRLSLRCRGLKTTSSIGCEHVRVLWIYGVDCGDNIVREGNTRYSIAFTGDISKLSGGFLITLRMYMLRSLSRNIMAVGILGARLEGCSGGTFVVYTIGLRPNAKCGRFKLTNHT